MHRGDVFGFIGPFTNSSLTVAIGALVVAIVMNILGAFTYFNFLKPRLSTSCVDAWQSPLRLAHRVESYS